MWQLIPPRSHGNWRRGICLKLDNFSGWLCPNLTMKVGQVLKQLVSQVMSPAPFPMCFIVFAMFFPEIFTEVWYSGNSTGVHHVRGISSGIHVQGGWLCRWSCIRFHQDIGFSPGICWIYPPGKLRFIGIIILVVNVNIHCFIVFFPMFFPT